MKSATFIVHHKIKPKERPRNGWHTPKATKLSEQIIAQEYKSQCRTFFEGFIEIEIKNYNKTPDSYSKAKRELISKGLLFPTVGDADNIIKTILDGLNKVAYPDDRKVACIKFSRKFSHCDYSQITIKDYYADN